MNPLVSVIMPAYNAEPYIAMAIESILNQTYGNYEFIIINDGSTDSTPSIIEKYGDSRIVYIRKRDNEGLVHQLNHGLRIAKGKYIARMDADDISVRTRLEWQVERMERDASIGVIGGQVECRLNNKRVRRPGMPLIDGEMRVWLLNYPPLYHPTVLMRASVLSEYGLEYSESYRPAEDYKMWVDLSRRTGMANLQQVVLLYRIHERQVSSMYGNIQLDKGRRIGMEVVNAFMGRELSDEESNVHDKLMGHVEIGENDIGNLREWVNVLIGRNADVCVYAPEMLEQRLLVLYRHALRKIYFMQCSKGCAPSMHKDEIRKSLSLKDMIKGQLKILRYRA